MKIVFLILIIPVIIFVIQTARIISYGKESKKLVEISKPFSINVNNPNKTILIVGDSLGVGVGAALGQSLSERLRDDYPQASISNLSTSGAKLIDGVRILDELDKSEKYSLIIIQLGANDITRFTPLNEAKESLVEILGLAKKHADQVIFLTSGSVGHAPIFIEPLKSFYSYRSKKFRAAFKVVAKEKKIDYVDLYFEKENDPFLKDINLFYSKDYFHPSGEGYGIWYKIIKEKIK
ncbi:MAG: SGNH/GDSL hydrolase family protein [bacterium]|nr:SGNH/GDSL hydrolase family protein [bacterium]